MGKWNLPISRGIALDSSKGAFGTVEYTIGPLSIGATGPIGLPNFEGDMWGGVWSFIPEKEGFPNTDRTYEGTRIRRYYDAMGKLLDTLTDVELLTVDRVSEADAIRYCATDGREFDPATSLCTGEPTPPPPEDGEPPAPPSEGLPWPVNKIFDAFWLIIGPFVVELEKLLNRIFAGPIGYLQGIAVGILNLPETLTKIGEVIDDAVKNPAKFFIDPIWAKLEELGIVTEDWRLPTWQEFSGFLWSPANGVIEWVAHNLGFEKQEGRGSFIWRRGEEPPKFPKSDLLGDIGRGLFRGITGDIDSQVENILKIAEGATAKGTPDWKKNLDDKLKPFAEDQLKAIKDSMEFESKLKSPLSDLDAKDAALGIATTAVGVASAIWLAHAAAEAASLGQYEALKDFDDMVITKLGLGAFAAKVLSIPLERGLFKPSEYFYNSLLTPEIPAYADLINMVVKEVLPIEDFDKQMGRLGYSKYWSTKIWDAHFIPPTRTELLRAHWRGKLSADALAKLEILVDLDPRFREIDGETGAVPLEVGGEGGGDFDIWKDLRYIDPSREEIRYMFETGAIETEDEYTEYLKRLGYREEDLEKLVNYGMRFQERFFRRRYLIALAQGFRLGTVTEDELKEGYKEAHYTEAVADWVIKAEEVRKGFRGDSREREATLARAISWYVGGFIEESDLKERLEGLGYAETEIDLFLEEANDKIEAKKEKIEEKIVLFSRPQLDSLLKDKTITEETYKTRMLEMGWKEETITEWLQHLQAPETVTEERQITASRVLNWFKKDVLDEAETRSRLTVLKYAPDDVELFIEETNLAKVEPQKDILQSEAGSAYRVGAIDEGTFRARLSMLGRTSDAINLIVATEGLKQQVSTQDFSRSQWDKLFKTGIITENEYRSRLGVLGYTPQGVEYWVALQKAGMFEKERTLSQAQIIDVWEKGQKDLVWFNRVVLGAATGEAATLQILEEWTIIRLKGLGMPEGDARILLEMEREAPESE